MIVVPYLGDAPAVQAADAPRSCAEVVAWLQARLADRMRCLDATYVQYIKTTFEQLPVRWEAPKRRTGARGGARKKPVIVNNMAASVTLAPYLAIAGQDGTQYGVFLELRLGHARASTPAQQGNLLNALLSDLEAALRKATYRIAANDGTALVGYASAAAGAESGPILDALSYPPFGAVDRLVSTSGGSAMSQADKATLAGLALVPTPQQNGWPASRPRRTPYLWNGGTSNDYGRLLQLRDPNFATRQAPLLWVPDQIAQLFYDSVESDSLYGRVGDIYTYRTADNAQIRIPRGHLPFYAVVGDALWSADVTKPTGTWPTDGVGGQGAMRCDARTEYDASFTEDGMFGLLGPALAIPAEAVAGAALTLRGSYQTGLAPRAIEYRKLYKAAQAAAKKSNPRAEPPLIFDIPAKDTAAKKSDAMRQLLKASGLIRKRKGAPGANGATPGIPVERPIADRLSANAVMRVDILDRFGAGGPAPQNWTGSATDLVNAVFAGDVLARAFWLARSAGLTTWQGGAAADARKSVIRTDQEWCHLFGHGDGGAEVPENFVAGSKHCNTEQLALELTQRIYRDDTLTVKITAYLMPTSRALHQANWQTLCQAFPGLAQQAVPNAGTLQQIVAAVPGANPAADFRQRQMAALASGVVAALKARAETNGSAEWSRTLSGEVINAPGAARYAGLDAAARTASLKSAGVAAAQAVFPIMPIASMMRYKVYVGAARAKAIDHIFAGQREEMDFFEFQLLQWLFRLKIARVLGAAEVQAVVALLQAKIA